MMHYSITIPVRSMADNDVRDGNANASWLVCLKAGVKLTKKRKEQQYVHY